MKPHFNKMYYILLDFMRYKSETYYETLSFGIFKKIRWSLIKYTIP